MIIFLKHNQIDKEKWNTCIKNASYPTIFADYDYLTLASPQWCALMEGDYETVMPLPVKSKFKIKYIYTPFFFTRLGIFSSSSIHEETVNAFIKAIPTLYKHVDILLNPSNFIAQNSLFLKNQISHALDLNRPYSAIQAAYSTNTKRNIASAQKENLNICEDVDPEQIVQFFKSGKGKSAEVHYQNQDYKLLLQLVSLAKERNQLDISGVKDGKGNLLAGAFFLKDYHRIWFWFSGRNMQFPDQKSMFMIIDDYLKKNENQNKVFDFNGSMNENIARFYRGFGGEKYHYGLLILRRHPWLTSCINLYKSIKK